MVVSDYAVQAIRGSGTDAPSVPMTRPPMDAHHGQVTPRRQEKVAENTKAGQAIGDPVVAEDKDGDVLTYTLGGG